MPSKKPRSAMPHANFVPRGNHSARTVRIETASGCSLDHSDDPDKKKRWLSILIEIRNDYDSSKEMRKFCKKHGLLYRPAGVLPDKEWKVVSEDGKTTKEVVGIDPDKRWTEDEFVWYEVSGGPTIEWLTTDQKDGRMPPSWVRRWTYAVGVGAPRFRSSTTPLSDHCPKPRRKKSGFKWHQAGQDWMELNPSDLTEDQQKGLQELCLGKEPEITGMWGKVGKEKVTPFVWLARCKFLPYQPPKEGEERPTTSLVGNIAPLVWSWKEGKWLGAESQSDLGKVPKPVLCKEWFGKTYMWMWIRPCGKGKHERSQYFQSEEDAKRMIRECSWYGEEEVEQFLKGDNNCPQEPSRRGGEFTNPEGWIGK